MTYVAGFFLVFAGMLIGYFLWYRDSTEEDQLRLALDRETEELRASLLSTQNSNAILEERFARQKGQLNVLQQLCDDWSTSREQSERDRAQLEIEVEDKRRKLDSVNADWQRAKQKQIELEDQLHALTRQHLEKTNKVDQDWLKKHTLTESSLVQRQTELKSSVRENETLTKSLHKAEGRIAELMAEIEANKKLLATATKNAGGLKQEYVTLESSLKESSDLLKAARAECATAVSEKKVAEQTIGSLQSQIKKLTADGEQLQKQLLDLKSVQQDSLTLKQTLAANQEQLEKVTQQRDLALKSEQSASSLASGLQTRLTNQESTIHGLREKHKDSLEAAKQELQLRSELETKFSGEAESRQKQIAEQIAEIADLKKQRETLSTELSQLKTEFSKTKSEIGNYEKRTQQLTAESSKLKADTLKIGELEKLLSDRDGKLKSELSKISELQKLITDRDGKLKQESSQKLAALQRIAEIEKLLNEKETRLKQESAQTSAAEECIAELEKSLAERDSRLKKENEQTTSAQNRILELEKSLHDREGRLKKENEQSASAQSRIRELETKLLDRDDRLKHESEQNSTTKNRIAELEKMLHERDCRLKQESEQSLSIKNRLSELTTTLAERENRIKQESSQTVSVQHRVGELERMLTERDGRTHSLENELKTLREQHASVEQQHRELIGQLESHSITQQQFDSMKRDYMAKIETLNLRLKSGEETIRQLRRERAGVLARLANYRTITEPDATVISFKQAMQERQRANYDQEYGGHVEHHELRGVVYTTEPEQRDDLKLISGIAEVLEARLNDFGIYTFKQIMDWKPEAIEEFSRLLAFRDRIQRDDWKGQAKYFYNKKMKEARLHKSTAA